MDKLDFGQPAYFEVNNVFAIVAIVSVVFPIAAIVASNSGHPDLSMLLFLPFAIMPVVLVVLAPDDGLNAMLMGMPSPNRKKEDEK